MLNRVVGLGVDRPATEEQLDEVIAVMAGTTYYVAVEPGAEPATIEAWLVARGFEPGWGWMRFARDASPAPAVETSLDVRRIGAGDGHAFAEVVRSAYGLPAEVAALLCDLPGREGWACWLATAAGEPAAAGALVVRGSAAYLGLGATVSEHRGKGGQGAIFAARIEHARTLGCTMLCTETGELRDGLPNASYRNIQRFGFAEHTVLRNWVRQPA